MPDSRWRRLSATARSSSSSVIRSPTSVAHEAAVVIGEGEAPEEPADADHHLCARFRREPPAASVASHGQRRRRGGRGGILTHESDVEIHAFRARGRWLSAIARHTGRDRGDLRMAELSLDVYVRTPVLSHAAAAVWRRECSGMSRSPASCRRSLCHPRDGAAVGRLELAGRGPATHFVTGQAHGCDEQQRLVGRATGLRQPLGRVLGGEAREGGADLDAPEPRPWSSRSGRRPCPIATRSPRRGGGRGRRGSARGPRRSACRCRSRSRRAAAGRVAGVEIGSDLIEGEGVALEVTERQALRMGGRVGRGRARRRGGG